MLIVNKIYFPCHCSLTYLLLRSIYARTEENVETVNDLVHMSRGQATDPHDCP